MVDIEIPDEQAENAGQRRMRKKFYLRAGYEETPVKYEWRHESYEILSFGGQVSEVEYDGFWESLRQQTERDDKDNGSIGRNKTTRERVNHTA